MKRSAPLRVTPNTAKTLVKVMRKCVICRALFEKRSMTHKACSPACAEIVAQKKREKDAAKAAKLERIENGRRREALKGRGDLLAEAQKAFNKYIRTRDAGKLCICCDKPFERQKFGGSMDAGHYLSRGSHPHLRFDEINVNGQRKNCNRPGGTTKDKFRAGMIARYGIEAIERLESDQDSREWTHDDLRAIKALYTAKTKELLKARA